MQMATNGQVRVGDEAWHEERWQPVAALPELRGRLSADPWDAWDSTEDATSDDVIARVQEPEEVEPEPEEAPPRRMVIRRQPEGVPPPGRPPAAVHSPGFGPTDGAPDEELDDEEDDPSPGDEVPLGQVIAFPQPRTRVPKLPVFPPNTPRSNQPTVRLRRVFAFVMLGASALAVVYLWVLTVGSTQGVQKAKPETQTDAEPTTLQPISSTTADPYRDMLLSLRGRLPQEVKSVRTPPDLGDAVLIELQNLETSVESVSAEVTKWTGPRGDQPKDATVVATFRDTESVDRDLAAFGLVMGRYMRAYAMKIPDARMVFHSPEGDVGRTIDAQSALDLYSGKTPLKQFLAE